MFGVVLAREIRSLLRHPGAAVLLLLAPLCAFSALVLFRWPTAGEVDLAGSRSMQVFRLFAYTVAGSILLLAPAVPAAAIVSERRRGTLALLLNTPLTGTSIYLGKLTAALSYAALPVCMSLPAAAACYALGSVELGEQLGMLYLVLAMIALQGTTLALAISCRANSAISAIRWTYFTLLLLAFASLVPAWLALKNNQPLTGLPLALRALSPVPAVMEVVRQADLLGGGGAAVKGAPWQYAGGAAVLSTVLALTTIRHLRPAMLDRSRDAGIVTDERSLRGRQVRRVLFLVDPLRRARGIPSWMNPILAKEFRTRQFGRGSWTLRILAFCAVFSLATTLAATTGAIAWSTESIGGMMVQLQVLLILVVTPSLASGLISDELENGGWSLLRMTPLSFRQIVLGKLLSVLATALMLLLATLPGYAVMMLIKPVMTGQVVTVLITLTLTAVFCLSLGAALSSLFRHTARATLACYGVLILFFGGTLAIWNSRDAPFGPPVVEAALSVNPVAAALSAIEAPGFESYHLLPQCWYFIGASAMVLLATMLWRTRMLMQPD